MYKCRCSVLLLFFTFTLAASGFSQVKQVPGKVPSKSDKAKLPPGSPDAPSAKQAESAAGETKKDEKPDYSQEAIVIQKLRREVRFEDDGTGVVTTTARALVQTQAGVQQMGQLVFGYNSANEKLDVVYLRVMQPDGSGVVNATQENYQDVPSQIQREAPSYTDYRERHITVPALRPGQVLEYQIRTTTTSPLIADNFWYENTFSHELITLNEELEVNVPAGKQIKLKNKSEYQPKVVEKDGRRIYLWTSSYLKRPSDDEQKKINRKRQKEGYIPDVQLTTFKSWEELGKWFAELEKPQMEPTPAIRAKAEELTKGLSTDEEKIRALYDFAAEDFRYVSLSFGVGRFQPHPAGEVLSNKYGDCKDKHTLFSSLLKAAGYTADPVLISTQRKLDPEMPSPSQFNHVITAIMEKGSTKPLYWADTTTEVAPFGLLAYPIRKKQALLVVLDGASKLVETPANPPFLSEQDMSLKGTISDLGKLSGTFSATYRGDLELAMRTTFRSVPENKWKDVAQYIAYVSGIGGDASDVRLKNLNDTHQPFGLEFNVSRPNFLDWSNKKTELDLPLPRVPLAGPGENFDDADASTGAGGEDSNASEDDSDDDADQATSADDKLIQLGAPIHTLMKLELQIPASYKSRSPVPISVKRDYAAYHSSYAVNGQTLTVTREMDIRQRELPKERRSDYMAFIRAVRSDEAQKFYLESTVAGNGAPKLPDDIKVDELLDSARDAMQSQNFKIALELLTRAAHKEPKHKQIWNMLGEAHMGLRQFSEAEKAFRKQIENDAFDQFAYNNLARSLWLQRRMDEAAEAFQKQLEVNPLDHDAYSGLGEVYLEMKKYDQAAEILEKAVALEPENGMVYADLGRAYLNLKREKDAVQAFDKAVELLPNPLLWNNIAYEMANSGTNLDRAQQYAESAVSAVAGSLRNVSPDGISMRDMGNVGALASYWDTLGWVAFKKGDVKKAQSYIEASWKLNPSGEVGDHLGQIYEKLGRRDDALRMYAEAISASRPIPEAHEHLQALLAKGQKLEDVVSKYKADLDSERKFSVPGISVKDGKADFLLVFSPGEMDSVRFLSGSPELKAAAASLKSLKYGELFPDNSPTKILRRGTLSCDPSGCQLTLVTPENVTSVD